MNNEYLSVNKNSWNARTQIHVSSDFYNVPAFKSGQSSLNDIELNLLGNVQGKSILHLQCHFGMDTISLGRLGAQPTGVDLSDSAIDEARKLAKDVNIDAKFVCCDVYSAPDYIDEKFDIVFTSYGTIGWLPDINKWADTVAHFLKPGGAFVFAEFHPVLWMFDDAFSKIDYSYFLDTPIVTTEETYTESEGEMFQSISWNHSIASALSSLIRNDIEITTLQEFDYSPYNCFQGTIEEEPGKFHIEKHGRKLPMVYALKGVKKK